MLPRIRLVEKALRRSKFSIVRSFASAEPGQTAELSPPAMPSPPPQFPPQPIQPVQPQPPNSPVSDKPPIIDIPPESDPLLAYITSLLMSHGKRHTAARRTSRLLLHLHAMTRSPPLPILREAIFLAAPSIRIVSHKQGGKNIQKPIPLGEKQRTRYAIKWMLDAAETRNGQKIEERLAREVLDVIKQDPENPVLKKKKAIHHLGMTNRANAKSKK